MGAVFQIEFQKKHHLFSAKSNFAQILEQVKPSGSTKLRDSICYGINKILEMNQEIPPTMDVHFLHIILTDGSDAGSTASLQKLAALMTVVGLKIKKKAITNHFIGINMSSSDEREFRALSILGLDTSEFHLSTAANAGEIFNRIQAEIQIEQKIALAAFQNGNQVGMLVREQQQVNLRISAKKFVIVFNLDISGSMAGNSWTQVKNQITRFSQVFSEDDLCSFILFNDQVREIVPNQNQLMDRQKFERMILQDIQIIEEIERSQQQRSPTPPPQRQIQDVYNLPRPQQNQTEQNRQFQTNPRDQKIEKESYCKSCIIF